MLLLQEGGGDRWLRLDKDHSGDRDRFRLCMSDCIVVLFQNKPTDGPFGGLGRAPRGVGMVNGITNNTNQIVEEMFLSVTIYFKV